MYPMLTDDPVVIFDTVERLHGPHCFYEDSAWCYDVTSGRAVWTWRGNVDLFAMFHDTTGIDLQMREILVSGPAVCPLYAVPRAVAGILDKFLSVTVVSGPDGVIAIPSVLPPEGRPTGCIAPWFKYVAHRIWLIAGRDVMPEDMSAEEAAHMKELADNPPSWQNLKVRGIV